MTVYHLFTGGTIGSRINADGQISTDENSPYRLIEAYKRNFRPDFNIECISVYEILSENLDANHLLMLIRAVGKLISSKKLKSGDGIIITHGTDTLQYSAAILGYVFGSVSVPIVLVSSDFVLDDSRANGIVNYRFALEFIKNTCEGGALLGTGGVYVSYCNKGGEPTIHLATRLTLPQEYSADVKSICSSHICTFSEENICGGKKSTNGGSVKDCSEKSSDLSGARLNLNPSFCVKGSLSLNLNPETLTLTDTSDYILRIRPYPGFKYPPLSEYIKAVIHESYHSGTICINDGLKAFARKAENLGIPIFLTGLDCRESEYETVEQYRELGIVPVRNSSAISLYCKLWLAVSNGLDINEVCTHSYSGDWV